MTIKKVLTLSFLGLAVGLLPAADFPQTEITNGQIRAKLYLPDGPVKK